MATAPAIPVFHPTATDSRFDQTVAWLMQQGGQRALDRWITSIPEADWERILADWEWNRRERQDLPPGEWASVVVQAGRGWGKTRYGVEAIKLWAEQQEPYPMYLVGPTGDDVRSVMVEGESGIMAKSSPSFRPTYEPSKRRLIWPNGVIAYTRSGDRPDRLRGPQGSKAWVDEICAMRYGGEVRDQLDLMIRLGDPRVVYTTTPRPSKLFRELIGEPDVIVIRGTTLENRRNLSKKFMKRVYRKYKDTRLGKQELGGELLGDNPGALWKLAQIEATRVRYAPIELRRVGVGVDPAVTSDPDSNETGIVVAGIAPCRCKCEKAGDKPEMHAFVIDDRSGIMSPEDWAEAVKDAYYENHADRVVPEVNNGGDLVVSNIRTLGDKNIQFVRGKNGKLGVHASRGKLTRAEPVSSLYEQGKIHHVGSFGLLETQMTQWNPLAKEKSPDRVDALVWVLTWLMLNDGKMSMAEAYSDDEDEEETGDDAA